MPLNFISCLTDDILATNDILRRKSRNKYVLQRVIHHIIHIRVTLLIHISKFFNKGVIQRGTSIHHTPVPPVIETEISTILTNTAFFHILSICFPLNWGKVDY